jgi:putative transposase
LTHATFGYRHLWAVRRGQTPHRVNKKAVYRVLRQKRRVKEAERAVEAAYLQRFGTLQSANAPVLHSDNGLIFQSRRFHHVCRDYRLQQEFITPYTPEQNGMIERFVRSLKDEYVWQHTVQTFEEARR